MVIRCRTWVKALVAALLLALVCAVLHRIAATAAAAIGNAKSEKKFTVVVDAGHGGKDGGASGADGTLEKDLNLDIAARLAGFLEVSGYDVVMTRTADVSLGAEEFDKVRDMRARLQMMRDCPGGLFVSVHLNKFTQSRYRGVQTFYSPNHGESLLLARSIQSSVRCRMQPENDRAVKSGKTNSYLLKNADCPAVIVECGFLSNEQELALLKTEQYRAKMAYCIYLGIVEFDIARHGAPVRDAPDAAAPADFARLDGEGRGKYETEVNVCVH